MKGDIAPLQMSSDFSFSDTGGGQFNSWIELIGSKTLFEKRGFFSSYDFHVQTYYRVFVVSPLNLQVHLGADSENVSPSRLPFIDKKNGLYSDYFKDLKWLGSVDLNSIGPWETVNSHQWTGRTPIERKDANGRVFETERPCWEVASVIEGERIMSYYGHNHRDEVFAYNYRLNAFFDYWRSYLEPFREEILSLNPQRVATINQVVDDSARARLDDIMGDFMVDTMSNPPP